jgi:hypothetical protein
MCFQGTCHIDNNSETDVEAATDPFLCPFLGSSGPVYLKGNVYTSDSFEAYHTGMWFSCLSTVLFPERLLEVLTVSPSHMHPKFKKVTVLTQGQL